MPVIRHHYAVQHRDRVRSQVVVERFHQPERGDVLRHIGMDPHPQRVDPGIGAPGGVQRNRLPGRGMDRLFHRLLYARPVSLALQAEERRAVEFKGEGEAGHFLVEKA